MSEVGQVLCAAVIQPCLARAVLLARDGQTVLYVVPGPEAAREALRIVNDLGGDTIVAPRAAAIMSVGSGSIQILQIANADLVECVRGRVGLIVLHGGLRYSTARQTANAINGHRHGADLAARADGIAWSATCADAPVDFTGKETMT